MPASQRQLFCACGQPLPLRAPRCRCCARAAWYSRRRFGSHREAVLERDGYCCQACGAGKSPRRLHVHHRRPGEHAPELLVTLCAACHARAHRLSANRVFLPSALLEFWREQHPAAPLQLQFLLEPAA